MKKAESLLTLPLWLTPKLSNLANNIKYLSRLKLSFLIKVGLRKTKTTALGG